MPDLPQAPHSPVRFWVPSEVMCFVVTGGSWVLGAICANCEEQDGCMRSESRCMGRRGVSDPEPSLNSEALWLGESPIEMRLEPDNQKFQ